MSAMCRRILRGRSAEGCIAADARRRNTDSIGSFNRLSNAKRRHGTDNVKPTSRRRKVPATFDHLRQAIRSTILPSRARRRAPRQAGNLAVDLSPWRSPTGHGTTLNTIMRAGADDASRIPSFSERQCRNREFPGKASCSSCQTIAAYGPLPTRKPRMSRRGTNRSRCGR